MIVKNIEKRIKVNKIVSLGAFILSFLIVAIGLFFAYSLVRNSQKSIYVIDNGVPVLVKQTDELLNRPVEYKSQIELFHRLFFTLAPDDDYIRDNINKSLYLIDESGKAEYNNLKEKGFYNQLISSNSMVSIHSDSIKIDLENMNFKFYGKQLIHRKTALIKRNLVTEGSFQDIIRSNNNSHGVLLTNWKIIDNSEIDTQKKYSVY